MENSLVQLGLSPLQAQVYLYLIEHGPKTPKDLVGVINVTRTNAYKVLESLEEVDLVYRSEDSKKLSFSPADPTELAGLAAKKRNDIIALEKNINQAMQVLRKKYRKSATDISVTKKTGREAMIKAYKDQLELYQPIYFYRTRADIPFMGFEAMDQIRKDQGKGSTNRYGITPDSVDSPINRQIDKSTDLIRTWVNQQDYTAPVEWSVSGDKLIIQVFEKDGSVITIDHPEIAESFRQIWKISDQALRATPEYKLRPQKANRQQ